MNRTKFWNIFQWVGVVAAALVLCSAISLLFFSKSTNSYNSYDLFYHYCDKFHENIDSSLAHTKKFIVYFNKHDQKGMDYEQSEAERFNDSANKYYYLESETLKKEN